MLRLSDPLLMPKTFETPQERLARGVPLTGTPGQWYVEKRGIPCSIAHEAGVRFDSDWSGRPAVIAPMYDLNSNLCSVHGRYLQHLGNENKMFTIGPGGGMINLLNSPDTDPIIIVEGLFDALSLAVCGFASLATVGRNVSWLQEFCTNKKVFLAFDANKPGEAEANHYRSLLKDANVSRIIPPHHSKDWNTALLKSGVAILSLHLQRYINKLQ